MSSQEGLLFDYHPIWISLSLEGAYGNDGLLTISFSSYNQGPVLVNFMSSYLLSRCLHKVHPERLTGGLFEGGGIIY